MRTLLPFLACLTVILTSWSGMADAAEAAGGNMGGFAFALHTQGDGDEVPADGDRAVPHHHSICHGHDVGAPAIAQTQPLLAMARVRRLVQNTRLLVGTHAVVQLRPPQA